MGQFRDFLCLEGCADQAVWQAGVDANKVAVWKFAKFPTVVEFAFGVVVGFQPDGLALGLEPRHGSGVGAMGDNFGSVLKRAIRKEAFVAADQCGADEGGGKLHGRTV